MEHSIEVASNKEFCAETVRLKEEMESNFLSLGLRLMRIRDERMFEPEHENFEDFLNDDLNMSKATASKLIAIYHKFVVLYEIPEKTLKQAGQDKLKEILPVVKDKESALEWVEKAIILRWRDSIRKEVSHHRRHTDPLKCEHINTYQLVVCRDCKERWSGIFSGDEEK
jgi:hypothetical protein